MSRRLAREELFKLIFESELKEDRLEKIYLEYVKRSKDDNIELNEEVVKFLSKYSKGIDEHEYDILKTIEDNMEGWSFERIGTVEKSLLKLAVYELKYEDTPKEVVINEAVEIAKKFGDIKSYEFINGVLAKIV